jgi:hypothetical protein
MSPLKTLLRLYLFGAGIFRSVAAAASPAASRLFTLVGCDSVDCHGILKGAVDQASAAVSNIDAIIDQGAP